MNRRAKATSKTAPCHPINNTNSSCCNNKHSNNSEMVSPIADPFHHRPRPPTMGVSRPSTHSMQTNSPIIHSPKQIHSRVSNRYVLSVFIKTLERLFSDMYLKHLAKFFLSTVSKIYTPRFSIFSKKPQMKDLVILHSVEVFRYFEISLIFEKITVF